MNEKKAHETAWQECLTIIRDNVNPQSFKTWFEPIRAVRLTNIVLTIQVPSQFFYEWLEEDVRDALLHELKKRWENETDSRCVFISAVERRDIDRFRTTLLNLVREMYTKRYPYKSGFGFQHDAF